MKHHNRNHLIEWLAIRIDHRIKAKTEGELMRKILIEREIKNNKK